ncbi:hypothetical protein ACEN9J_37405 [Variovorax sp. Varisp41]|jgi:hypothetical protein|uniref:hypothetical protein n=1 Tax=unclassified Variovorax TaxID=663243 RepID=UPI0021BBA304|nr:MULTISPECIES: hypothetical protein [unclassified Variovorax]MCT8177844.1 hypothetical protein [Variovorax sp. CY25R-8]
MRLEQARSDERDGRRVFRWGIGAVIVVVLLVVIYNVMSHRRNDAAPAGGQGITQPAPQSAPASPNGGGAAGVGGVTGNGGDGGQSQTGTQ